MRDPRVRLGASGPDARGEVLLGFNGWVPNDRIPTQPWQMGAVEVARLVARGDLSATEVVESHRARADAVNGKLNAIVLRTDEDALAGAARVDDGSVSGPIAGAVITTKANTDHVPYPNDNGVKGLAANPSHSVAPCIRGLLEAGGLMLGRTNTPAFSMRLHTDNDLHGETQNPYGRHITCGGSSGGAASAVAAGMCSIAQGNDVGGSIRFPAFSNGIWGLRPTMGRMTSGGTNPNARGWTAAHMSTHGPLARNMEDLRAAYAAMNRPNWDDPFWVPAPDEFPGGDAPVRVALVTEDGHGMSDVTRNAVRLTGRVLAEAGYEVDEVTPPMTEEIFGLWQRLGAVDLLLGLVPMLEAIGDAGLAEVYGHWKDTFPEPTGATFMTAFQSRDTVLRAWNTFLATYPLVVMPVYSDPFMRSGQDRESAVAMRDVAEKARWVLNLPALGIPALAVPTGVIDGAPHGVQIASHAWREDILLRAGDVIEQATGRIAPVDPTW